MGKRDDGESKVDFNVQQQLSKFNQKRDGEVRELQARKFVVETPYVKMLAVGPPKSGKTHMIGTFPGPTWVADLDELIDSAVKSNPDIEFNSLEHPSYREINRLNPVACDWFLEDLEKAISNPKYKTIAIDSLTSMYDIVMYKALALRNRAGQPIPTQQDWLLQMNLAQQILERITSVREKHIVVTAHIQTDKDEITGKIFKAPLVTGKHAHRIPMYFNMFVYMDRMTINNQTYPAIRTKPDTYIEVGTTFNLDELEPNNFNVFYPKILRSYQGKGGNQK